MKKILIAIILGALAISFTSCHSNDVQKADISNVSSSASENSSSDTTSKLTEEKTAIEKATEKNKDEKSSSSVSSATSKVDDTEDSKTKDNKNNKNNVSQSNNSSSTNSPSGNSGGNVTQTTTTNNDSAGNKNSNTNKNNNTSNKTNTSKPSTTNKPGSNSKPSTGTNNKTYHEAVYKIVNHPAKTKQVWVVDQKAYTYEEPVYEMQGRTICNGCGADITNNLREHATNHLIKHEQANYHDEWVNVQVGTKTVTVPEQGHYETQVVKEAWTEKVLVKEAGWY